MSIIVSSRRESRSGCLNQRDHLDVEEDISTKPFLKSTRSSRSFSPLPNHPREGEGIRERNCSYANLFNRQFFTSPQPAGRKITAGFTYLQLIGKAANFDVWFPDKLKAELAGMMANDKAIGSEQFPVQWAAIRQFELLQESGNHKIYDLDPLNLQRSMLDLSRSMRAGGYRITVATLGSYCDDCAGDELEILDTSLQEDIENIIHMLYLDEASKQADICNDSKLDACTWDYRSALPHVGVTLGAQELFGNASAGSGHLKRKHAQQFFSVLGKLPHKHILHDTAIGLQLPELTGRNQWNYIASPEETLAAFNRVLGDLFDKFNGISLSRLQGREDATAEVKSSTLHLRGYGDRLNDSGDKFLCSAAFVLG